MVGLTSPVSGQQPLPDPDQVRQSLVGTEWLVGFEAAATAPDFRITRKPDASSPATVRVRFLTNEISVVGPCGAATGKWTLTGPSLRLAATIPEICANGSEHQAQTIALLRRGIGVDPGISNAASFRSPVAVTPFFFRVPRAAPAFDLTTTDWTVSDYDNKPYGPLPIRFRFRADGVLQVIKPCNSRITHWLLEGFSFTDSPSETTAVGCVGGFASDAADEALGRATTLTSQPNGAVTFAADELTLTLRPLPRAQWLTNASYTHRSGTKLTVNDSGVVNASLRCGTSTTKLQSKLVFDPAGNATLVPTWTGGPAACVATLRQTIRSLQQPIDYPALVVGTGWKRSDGSFGRLAGTRWRRNADSSTDSFAYMPDELQFRRDGTLSTRGISNSFVSYTCTYEYRILSNGSAITHPIDAKPKSHQCGEAFPITSFRVDTRSLEIDALRGISRYDRMK
jgi:hypothetical protein